MPLIVHNHYHQHHTHHYPDNNEHYRVMLSLLSQLAHHMEGFEMIPAEVQALIDQSKQNNDVLKSMQLHYDAVATLVGQLQATITALRAGSVLSDTEKALLVAQTSDLAATATTAAADITKNTPLESAAVEQPAPQTAPEPAAAASTDTTSGAAASTDTTTDTTAKT